MAHPLISIAGCKPPFNCDAFCPRYEPGPSERHPPGAGEARLSQDLERVDLSRHLGPAGGAATLCSLRHAAPDQRNVTW